MAKKNKKLEIKHPVQKIYEDDNGILRFVDNPIVRMLLDSGPFDLNKLAMMDFTDDDRAQFAQLIGYSLSGFGELSYVTDEAWDKATKKATKTKRGKNKKRKDATQ